MTRSYDAWPPDTPGTTSWTPDDPSDPMDDERKCRATSKRSGQRCKRYPVPGGSVCVMHGGASPQARVAAERRRAQEEATRMLASIWDEEAPPITDPVSELEELAGRLKHAAKVLGAHLDAGRLDQVLAAAFTRVLSELRRTLVGLEQLDLETKRIQFQQAQAELIVAAFKAGVGAVASQLLTPADRIAMETAFLRALGVVDAELDGEDEATSTALEVVRGEVDG